MDATHSGWARSISSIDKIWLISCFSSCHAWRLAGYWGEWIESSSAECNSTSCLAALFWTRYLYHMWWSSQRIFKNLACCTVYSSNISTSFRQSFSYMFCTSLVVSVSPSGPGKVLVVGLYWWHCRQLGFEELWGFLFALMEFHFLFPSTPRLRVACCQIWIVYCVRFIDLCMFEFWEGAGSECDHHMLLVGRKLLETGWGCTGCLKSTRHIL